VIRDGGELSFDVGDSEDGAFWTAFLHSLKARGLHGVQLIISDAHAGLKAAISSVLLGLRRFVEQPSRKQPAPYPVCVVGDRLSVSIAQSISATRA
jgi:hypothetical protein